MRATKSAIWILGGATLLCLTWLGYRSLNDTDNFRAPVFQIDPTGIDSPADRSYSEYARLLREAKIPTDIPKESFLVSGAKYASSSSVLSQNRMTIKKLLRLLDRPFVPPKSKNLIQVGQQISKFQSLAYLLLMDADHLYLSGKPEAGFRGYLLVARMGLQLIRACDQDSVRVGEKILELGLRAAECAWTKVRTISDATFLMDVKAIPPFKKVIEMERERVELAWQELFSQPDWPRNLRKQLGVARITGSSATEALLERTDPALIFKNSKSFYDSWISRASGVFASRTKALPSPAPADQPTDMVNGFLYETLALYDMDDLGWLEFLRSICAARLVTIVVSNSVHGWATLPEDPFAPGHQLRRKSVPGGMLIYSVGPDGQDNGGKDMISPYGIEASTSFLVFKGDVGYLLRESSQK